LPELERLAIRYLGAASPRRRSMLLRHYLEASLRDYAEAGNALEAELIKRLFFDTKGLPLGARSPGELLADARKETNLKDKPDIFRRLQHGLFHEFAEFLIDLQPPQQPKVD
jgi:hypothetical protein